MKRVVILRHAKTEKQAQTDHARRLTERGHEQAKQCAKWLASLPFKIDHAIVSTATRTTQTWEELGLSCPVEFSDDAYNASAEDWVHLIRGCAEEVETLLFVGHSPGVSDLAYAHGFNGELSPCDAVVIELEGPWNQFGLHGGTVAQTFEPQRTD